MRGPLSLLISVAVLLRLAWVFAVPPGLYADSEWYYEQGVNLAQGVGYLYQGQPSAIWPVGYPFFLSLVFRLAGPSVRAAQLANVILLAVDLLLIATLAQRVSGSRSVALGAAAVMAFAPTHIIAASVLATEPLYACLLHAQLLWLLLALHRQQLWLWILNGAWAGLTAYVRPESMAVLLIVLGAYLLTNRVYAPRRGWSLRPLGGALLVGGAAVVVLLPWALRNWTHLGIATPFATNSCMNIWIGANPDATGGFYWPNDAAVNPTVLRPGDTEPVWYRRSCQAAQEAVLADPWRVVALWPAKLRHLWIDDENIVYWAYRSAYASAAPPHIEWAYAIANGYYYGVLGLGLAGSAVWLSTGRTWPGATPTAQTRMGEERLGYAVLLAALVALMLVYLPFFGSTRFHFALYPLLAIFGVRLLHVRPGSLPA